MSRQQELHYKDKRPEDTIANIQRILEELGISVVETEIPKSSADTYSVRVDIRGTGLGSNGKGISMTYARASAYAEFMERLQNDILTLFTKCPKHQKGFRHFPDEVCLSSEKLSGMRNAFMDYFFKIRGMEKCTPKDRAEYLRKNHKLDFFLNGEQNSYQARPFYSVREDRVEYLPYYLYLPYYGSNGMSAGNTPEEALVQGFSELIERRVQEKIYLEKPALPEIPDQYIQKFPYVWERVQKLRAIPGIRVYMKDCSFGGIYPVAALILVDIDSGQYGVKLGCHPDFGIAMERTITEASQGNDFNIYARRSTLDFSNRDVDSPRNIYNSYKYGLAPFPYQIFGEKSTYPFVPVRDVAGMGNREILDRILQEFLGQGYDVLIRDVSYTGFPSYHMIVPGFSEIMRDDSLLYTRAINTKAYLIPYLNYPETIDRRIAELLRGSLDFWSDYQIENTMKNHYCVYPDFSFPGEELQLGWLYLSAMCCAFLGQYKEAADRMRCLAAAADSQNSGRASFYKAVYAYLDGRGQDIPHGQAISYLRDFFSRELCDELDNIFQAEERIFTVQYPRFDYQGRDRKTDDSACEYNIWMQTKQKMIAYMLEHAVSQEHVRETIRHKP